MALDLTVTYPGQVDDGDPDYPQGRARNLVVEGDGTGTPWEEQLVNDWFGFHQALLLAAGITPSGNPDNANDSQYKEAVEWIAASAHNTFDPVVMFGAVGRIVTESEDDTSALQDCFDAAKAFIASASGGGNVTVDLGGRQYRITGTITGISPHVNVKNGKLVMYHATANALGFSVASTLRTAGVWENVDIAYAESNSGIPILNDSAVVRVTFRNCRINASGFCSGRLYFSDNAASVFQFDDCIARSATTTFAFLSTLGTIIVNGGEYTMAPGATSDMFSAAHLRADGPKLTHVSTVGGVAFFVTASGNICIVSDCICDVNDSAAGAGTSLVRLTAGAVAETSGNILRNNATLYIQDGLVAARSRLQLLPELAFTTTSGTPSAPPVFETVTIRVENASPPVVALGDPLFVGQFRRIAVRNIQGSAWTGAIGFSSGSDVAYTEAGGLTDLADDEIATIAFVAATLDTGLTWVQVGNAAQHFVAS